MATTKTGTKTRIKKVVKPAVKQTAKGKLEKTNKKVITQKVIMHRALDYIYPKGCTNTLARKAFRQQIRNKIRKMERDISKLRGEDRRVLKVKMAEYIAENKR